MDFKKIFIAILIVIALGAGVALYYYYFVLNKIPQSAPITTNTQLPTTQDTSQSNTSTQSQTTTSPNPTPASDKVIVGRTDTSSPLPSIAPNFSCKVDSDCGIDPNCKAVNKSTLPQDSGNSSCQGTVKCMYGACALVK